MKYSGSKNRFAKDILKAIENDIPSIYCNPLTNWVEPFVGGCNIIDKVPFVNRFGNDLNFHLIEMFKAVQKGWIPPDFISEQEYQIIKNSRFDRMQDLEYNALIGFVGIGCSFSGIWYNGYCRGKNDKGIERNYCFESKNNIIKQNKKLCDVIFSSKSYNELIIERNSIIYCDPPYADTRNHLSGFNSNEFWLWCDEMVSKGNHVYVSEYNAPEGWECIWEKDIQTKINLSKKKNATEKLFTRRMSIILNG